MYIDFSWIRCKSVSWTALKMCCVDSVLLVFFKVGWQMVVGLCSLEQFDRLFLGKKALAAKESPTTWPESLLISK